ncbi:MAG: hypothetical protein Kow0090_09560 [Myxococcota bacterium]
MTIFVEENVEFSFPSGMKVRKFDDSSHGLSYCMQAVDFIVEFDNGFFFIEVKEPRDLKMDNLVNSLKYKYRDSFLYEWASYRANNIYYLVLIPTETLTEAQLLQAKDSLKKNLPLLKVPSATGWKRNIVEGVQVFNISTWNKYKLKGITVKRVKQT